MPSRWTRLTAAMDKLYEFDREAVTPDKLRSGGKFAGLFAGEHVAAVGREMHPGLMAYEAVGRAGRSRSSPGR